MVSKSAEIARPYAKAAFDFAEEHHQVAEWAGALGVVTALCETPKINKALRSPYYQSQEKAEILLFLAGEFLNPSMQNLIHLLCKNKRLLLIPAIYQQFLWYQEAALHQLDAEIMTAYPLSEAVKTALVKALEKRTKARITLHSHIVPALIGGIQIRIGDEVIDNSVLGKVQRLAHYLQLKEIPCQ